MSDDLRLQWRTVSLVSLLLTIAAIATLVVVVAVEDAELLATVALALAVLAFASQLVGSAVQSNAASQQLLHAERVHTQTSAALTEIRAHTAAVSESVSNQFDRLLTHVLAALPAELAASGSDTVDVDEIAERVRTIVQRDFPIDLTVGKVLLEAGAKLVGKLRPGDWIDHRLFGQGEVAAIGHTTEGEEEITVDFRNAGRRSLVTRREPIWLHPRPSN